MSGEATGPACCDAGHAFVRAPYGTREGRTLRLAACCCRCRCRRHHRPFHSRHASRPGELDPGAALPVGRMRGAIPHHHVRARTPASNSLPSPVLLNAQPTLSPLYPPCPRLSFFAAARSLLARSSRPPPPFPATLLSLFPPPARACPPAARLSLPPLASQPWRSRSASSWAWCPRTCSSRCSTTASSPRAPCWRCSPSSSR